MGRPSDRPIESDECLRCGEPIESLGVEGFRVGGTGGGWKLLFGEASASRCAS